MATQRIDHLILASEVEHSKRSRARVSIRVLKKEPGSQIAEVEEWWNGAKKRSIDSFVNGASGSYRSLHLTGVAPDRTEGP